MLALYFHLQIKYLMARLQQLSEKLTVHNPKPVLILPQEQPLRRDQGQYRPVSTISDDFFLHSRTNTSNSDREWLNSIWENRHVDPDAETVIMSESEVEFVTLAVEYQDSTISITCDDELYEYSSGLNAQWPAKLLAPYTDITLFPTLDINTVQKQTGINYFTVGPIISDANGNPAWGGTTPATAQPPFYLDKITTLRSNGGDVVLYFGGPGMEIARNTSSVNDLVQKYQSVITAYSATYITIDIEASATLDSNANELRNQALAVIQKNNPKLKVSLTLPTYVSGIDYTGLDILKSTIKNKVVLSSVNLITADYGTSGAPNGATGMGGYAISAIEGTIPQLEKIGLKNQTLGVAPIIGANNVQGEVFRLEDAQQFAAYANKSSVIGVIAYNKLNRDTNVNGTIVQSSQINQLLFGFASIFKPWAGINTPTDTTPLPTGGALGAVSLGLAVLCMVFAF
ncbi:hypothetical protein HDV01_003447 [Terramyces sp. JEL0728]|nr:hypothetical protein HDV01_003447 [Terramyces sp. JEL0728]